MIIGLCGLASSGKSTAAAALEDIGFRRVSFADPLRRMLLAFGVTVDELADKEAPCAALCGRTVRYAMQTLGTEWGRELVGPDVWTRAWAREEAVKWADVVADDVRFPNEADVIRSAGGIVVRIVRPGLIAGDHLSERQVINADVEIINGSTIECLRNEVANLRGRK